MVNQGRLIGGFVALLGNQVENSGLISTIRGSTALTAADGITLNFDAAGLIAIKVDMAAYDALVHNSGVIEADGGRVVMTAAAANQLLTTVINTDGIVQARTAEQKNGQIIIDGGDNGITRVAGSLDASSSAGTGGTIIATGSHVLIDEGAQLNATGATGGGQILVGGGWQGGDPTIRHALATVVAPGAILDASATDNGNGGTIVAWSDVTNPLSVSRAYGSFLAKGGPNGGDGGRIETSGHWLDTAGIDVTAAAPEGKGGLWLIDPTDLVLDQNTLNGYADTLDGGTDVLALADQDITTDPTALSLLLNLSDSANSDPVTFTLQADRNILLGTSSGYSLFITSSSNPLSVVLNADHDASKAGAVLLANTIIQTNGGSITIGGGTDPATTPAYGYTTDGLLANFLGQLTLPGVGIESSTLDAQGGTISIRGVAAPAGDVGLYIGNSTIQTAAAGTITLNGDARSWTGTLPTSGNHNGVEINSSTIAAENGAISITGYGANEQTGTSGGNNYGVYLIGSEIYTDQGNITVTGYGGSSDGYDNYGVFFGATNMYTNYQTPDASYGTITIEGHGGGNATSTSDSNHGVFLTDGTWLEAAGGVDITGFGGLGSGQENTGVRIEDSYLDTYKDNYNESGTYTGTSTGEISITGTGVERLMVTALAMAYTCLTVKYWQNKATLPSTAQPARAAPVPHLPECSWMVHT